MARSKNQFLQNVHTTEKYSLAKIAEAQLKDGEIAVFQNTEEPSLGIKVGNTYAQFKDSEAVTAEINSAKTELNTTISSHTTKIGELEAKFGKYATSADTVSADEKVLSSAKTYTDLLKAKEGEKYNGETLAGLKSEINSLKEGGDTSVGGLATRVSTAEGKITALETTVGKTDNEGLRKDVADLKTTVGNSTTGLVKDVADLNTKIDAVSGASSAYTDSQINAIKGGETTATLSSLKSDIDNQGSAISGITNSTKLDSFKAVENEINSKISSVYKVRGTKATYAELPIEGNNVGDVYNVTAANGNTPAGTNYVCTATTGTLDEQWDALGGTIDLSPYATTATTKGLESRLDTAESNIKTLTAATGTLNTSITTIQGWKINGSAITSDTVLNGTNLKVDTTAGAKTLNEAIAEAAQSGSNANNAFTAWTAGTYSENQAAINTKFGKIDAYTVNGTPISKNPVLTGENVLVGGESADSAKTLNTTIAEAKAAGTTASEAITALRDGYDGTIKSINDSVTTNTSDIAQLKTDVTDISGKANSAIQRITIKANADAGVTISEPTGGDGTKTQELDFSAIVIDCGTF